MPDPRRALERREVAVPLDGFEHTRSVFWG
jgi:hypothetical protein